MDWESAVPVSVTGAGPGQVAVAAGREAVVARVEPGAPVADCFPWVGS